MAKKQTRRSISVSKNTYERLKTYCEANGVSMSQFIERRIGDFLSCSQGIPEVALREEAVPREPARREPAQASPRRKTGPDQIFTF